MARKKQVALPPQFKYAPVSEREDDRDAKAMRLCAFLKALWKNWDDARRNEVVSVWRAAWENFNSVVQSDATSSSRGQKTWRSKAFHPITEQKVMAGTSQIDDVLFRSGDFPYSFRVSPISDAGLAAVLFDDAEGVTPEVQEKLQARRIAEQRMRLMKKKVDDQLTECHAVDQARKVTFQAALYGTAAIEAPVVVRRTRNRWEQGEDGQFVNKPVEEDTPSMRALDIWDCWPDPDCEGDVQEGRGFFHRQSLTVADLRALHSQVFGKSKSSGEENYSYDYRKDEFDGLLREISGTGPVEEQSPDAPERAEDRPWLETSGRGQSGNLVEVMKFAGAVPNKFLAGIVDDVEGDDGYTEVIVHFCKDFVIKASANPFPKQRRPYYLVPFTKIPGSAWGRGVAQKIFDHQENINRLLRQYIDNKRLSGNLMTAIDKSKMKKGETMDIYPGRNFEFEAGYVDSDVRRLIQPVVLPDVTGGVLEAIQMFMEWADQASGIPRILEGSTGGDAQTAFAENQRIIAASKQLGLVLKNLDLYGWVPVVESFYDWNMEFSTEDAVKGEYQVIATGFSSFENKNMKKLDLERMLLMSQQMPVLAARIKAAPLLEDWFQTSSLDVDRYLRSEAEAQQAAQMEQEQAMQQQAAMLEYQQAMKGNEHAAELEVIRAKADFAGATRTQLESMRSEAKMITDRMKLEAQKMIKAAEIELGLRKLEVDREKSKGGTAGGGSFSAGSAGSGKARNIPRNKGRG